MVRIHKQIERRAQKVDPDKIANQAEDYLYGFSLHKKYLKGAPYLINADRIKAGIKRVDQLEREIVKTEENLDRLAERRAIEAAKLEEDIDNNFGILEEYLEPEEIRDFMG
jgi:hypothetical protein